MCPKLTEQEMMRVAPAAPLFCRRIANTVIGSSSLRNQGGPGVIRLARDFLAQVALERFVRGSESEFLAELDHQTEALLERLRPAAGWGTARKALNLFLEEACYHRFLSHKYGLDRIARFLEVPLDGQVARFLIKRANESGQTLPRWHTIKGLSPEQSREYQDFALKYAGDTWFRVHLDLIAWRGEEAPGSSPD